MVAHSKLLMLVSMHRHGARTTEKFFNSAWFPLGKKQLTPLGEIQMKDLGNYYRTRYFSDLSFSERDYPIYISSPLKRALDSAKNVYTGLYPNVFLSHYNEMYIDFPKYLSSDLFTDIKYSGFPIFVQNPESDYLFHSFKKSICPKAARLMKNKEKCSEALEKLEDLRGTLFKSLSKSLKKAMNIEINPNEMTYSDMKGIYDIIVSTKAHNIPANFELSLIDFEKLKRERRDFVLKYKLGDPLLVRFSTTRFFQLLLKFLSEKKERVLSNYQRQNTTKAYDNPISLNSNMILFSSHDTILNLLLNALLTEEEKTRLDSEMDLKYGSHLDFELHQLNDEFFIQVYLNKKIVNLTKCNNEVFGKCKFEDFQGFLDNFIVNDLENECFK